MNVRRKQQIKPRERRKKETTEINELKDKDSVKQKNEKLILLKILIKLTDLSWDKKESEVTSNIRIKKGNTDIAKF